MEFHLVRGARRIPVCSEFPRYLHLLDILGLRKEKRTVVIIIASSLVIRFRAV